MELESKYEFFRLSSFEWDKESHINYLDGDFSDSDSRYHAIFDKIEFLSNDYPGFRNWYFKKVIPGIERSEREILICLVNEPTAFKLGGVAILKNTIQEKKICTLRVTPEYEKNGVGYKLFEKSFDILKSTKPVFTVSEDRLKMFERHLKRYKFERTDIVKGFYSEGKLEYVFNGSLK